MIGGKQTPTNGASRLKNRLRVIAGVFGIALLCNGLISAFHWHYNLAPKRRTLDPKWVSQHSGEEYWQEIQAAVRRGYCGHDDGFIVGHFGDERWANWIMSQVKPETSMGCLGSFMPHADYAMSYITNHDYGENAEAWMAWWKLNSNKSQDDWITDGFKANGLTIDQVPTPRQTIMLLEMLAVPLPEEESGHLRFNGCRRLRDAGFSVDAFRQSNPSAAKSLQAGIDQYVKYERLSALSTERDFAADQNRTPSKLIICQTEYKIWRLLWTWGSSTIGVLLILMSLGRRRLSHRLARHVGQPRKNSV